MNNNIVWIASYPKSGNTWMRSIISSLIYTHEGSFDFSDLKKILYFDNPSNYFFLKKEKNPDFEKLIELDTISKYWLAAQRNFNRQGKVSFFKTHSANLNFVGRPYTDNNNARGIIYLIRDPRDIAISYSKHINKKIDDVIKIMKLKKHVTLNNKFFYPSIISSWDAHVVSWYKNKIPKIFIKYEDLIQEPFETLKKIVYFLENDLQINEKISDKKILNTIKNTSFSVQQEKEEREGFEEALPNSVFFNTGKNRQWEAGLTKSQQTEIKKSFDQTMSAFGYV